MYRYNFQNILDTLVKIASIASPIITGWLGWQIAQQLKVKESIYQKREIIYRELYKSIEEYFLTNNGVSTYHSSEKRLQDMQNKHIIFQKFYRTEKLYLSKDIEVLSKELTSIGLTINTYREKTLYEYEDTNDYNSKELQEREKFKSYKSKVEEQIKKELKIED